jgi:hypothetical protein
MDEFLVSTRTELKSRTTMNNINDKLFYELDSLLREALLVRLAQEIVGIVNRELRWKFY